MTESRWRVPVGAVLVHLSIGSVYAWSTFNRPIQQLFVGQPWWSNPPYTTFTTALALLGLSAAIGGPWVGKRPSDHCSFALIATRSRTSDDLHQKSPSACTPRPAHPVGQAM